MKTIKLCLLLFCLSCLVGCGQLDVANPLRSDRLNFSTNNSKLAEIATPKIITELNQQLEQYNPQVKIVAPRQDRIFSNTAVSIELEVENLPVFQDERLKLGNHLDLILDNEPAKSIYDVSQPVIFKDLTPGTHTLRVFAARPWGESYKNEGAYAQITFSVLTETNDNRPDRSLPLLTYSNPRGTYGAEPILLDFYLTNAPLHSFAQNDPSLSDWKIKTTVNGDSFLLENWQPIYLTGLNQGENWIQLELIDEAGKNIENTYNNTVGVINYDPQQSNTLSRLMTDEITLADAQPLIEQNYYIQPVGEPEIIQPENTQPENTQPETKLEESPQAKDVKPVPISPIEKAIEEPTVEDNTQEISSLKTQKSNSSDLITQPLRELPTASSTPVVVRMPAQEKITEEPKIVNGNLSKPIEKIELAGSSESEQTITVTEENSDTSEPIVAIAIPELESVEISGDEIAITIPPVESNPATEIETQSPVWWKNILVRLRHKLEGLVKLLPSKV